MMSRVAYREDVNLEEASVPACRPRPCSSKRDLLSLLHFLLLCMPEVQRTEETLPQNETKCNFLCVCGSSRGF